jgi:hypothetical protein
MDVCMRTVVGAWSLELGDWRESSILRSCQVPKKMNAETAKPKPLVTPLDVTSVNYHAQG